MNMTSVLEISIDDPVCSTRSINLILDHVFSLERTEHHQDLLMGFIPTLVREWKLRKTKIDSFGAFLQDSTVSASSDEKLTLPNRFSWNIDPRKFKKLPKYTDVSGQLQIIKCDDPKWETINHVIMEKNIEREAVIKLIQLNLKAQHSSEKKVCHYFLYDMRHFQVKDNLSKKYEPIPWFLETKWREDHCGCIKSCPQWIQSCHFWVKSQC